jgi:hypothetical protein
MSEINDGGPAFPRTTFDVKTPQQLSPYEVVAVDGMTLRDYFAAKAMQAYLANMQLMLSPTGDRITDVGHIEGICRLSWQAADLMLAERKAV